MIFSSAVPFTSDPIKYVASPFFDCYVTVSGVGPVRIELLEEDGAWRSFPETVLRGPAATLLTLKSGYFRVVIEAGPTTVEVRLP